MSLELNFKKPTVVCVVAESNSDESKKSPFCFLGWPVQKKEPLIGQQLRLELVFADDKLIFGDEEFISQDKRKAKFSPVMQIRKEFSNEKQREDRKKMKRQIFNWGR